MSATSAELAAVMDATPGVRRFGAAALDLAYVAAGRFDGFWEHGLKAWDMAAGIVLVREAGGLVSDLDGGSRTLEAGHILVANETLHPHAPETFEGTPPRTVTGSVERAGVGDYCRRRIAGLKFHVHETNSPSTDCCVGVSRSHCLPQPRCIRAKM